MIFKKGKSCKASLNSQIKFQTIQCSSIMLEGLEFGFYKLHAVASKFGFEDIDFS